MKKLLALLFVCSIAYGSDVSLVLYTAPNCGPCISFKAMLNELKIVTVEGRETGNEKLTGYPTLIVVVDGVEQARINGYVGKEKLLEIIDPYRNGTAKVAPQEVRTNEVRAKVCTKD